MLTRTKTMSKFSSKSFHLQLKFIFYHLSSTWQRRLRFQPTFYFKSRKPQERRISKFEALYTDKPSIKARLII